ncbi:unnamed protein product [Rhizoctonia solani]|uniref:PNPLA domain-containing protein n=1 Tax=Rhizoctonia solani TaxID=456999 RepID=A0A8H3D1B7_9AGAM|nr:unnamed protein product [Rhizoctonia solani]
MQGNSGEQSGLNLLSLDGGGVTGLSSLLILKELMSRAQKKDRRDTVPKPCELFDTIAGTGTGAISAVMLGRPRMEIDEAIRTYTRLMKTVFSERKYTLKGDTGRFKASVLESELNRMIGSVLGDKDQKMVEEEQADEGTRCKVVVYASSASRDPSAGPVAFRSYPSTITPTRCTIWEALRATTAHPQMFKPIQVDVEDTGLRDLFMCGGLMCTNPTPRLLEEAEQVYPGRGVASITSIGTENPGPIQLTTGFWDSGDQ